MEKICKTCGKPIDHNYKRKICLSCLKEEQRANYNFNQAKYYKARRLKTAKPKVEKTCVVCETKFETTYSKKITCYFECSEVNRRRLSLEAYYKNKNG